MTTRRTRRGTYNAMLGFLLPVAVGFTAISVDTSWVQLASSQAQDVADAASHAALIQLRSSGSIDDATAAANTILNENHIANDYGTLEDIKFGYWERSSGDFTVTDERPNAVRVNVGRFEDNPIDLHFARIWGNDEALVDATATSATRSLNVVLVIDITGSFKNEIQWARAASVSFLDILIDTHGQDDMAGMATFTSSFGHEWTPMFDLADDALADDARVQWTGLDIASRPLDNECNSYFRYGTVTTKMFDWSTNGHHPQMPREYCDEPSTDQHVGIHMGTTMLSELSDPFAYRAMVVLTDGNPQGIGTQTMRDTDGFTMDRWRIYEGPSPHSKSSIETKSVSEAVAAHNDHDIHVWMVSFEATGGFLANIPQGDGKFYFTTKPEELVPIFEEIANSMPLLIVE